IDAGFSIAFDDSTNLRSRCSGDGTRGGRLKPMMTRQSAYDRTMKFVAALLISMSLAAPAGALQKNTTASGSPQLTDILDHMRTHDEWQNRNLVEYQMQRRFYAANTRFKQESVLEAKTTFRQPNSFETEVVRTEGSELIRERVFDKILEAEKEANRQK